MGGGHCKGVCPQRPSFCKQYMQGYLFCAACQTLINPDVDFKDKDKDKDKERKQQSNKKTNLCPCCHLMLRKHSRGYGKYRAKICPVKRY